jgi:methyl-accepting chemotaxis protein
MKRSRGALGFVAALSLALGACATSGDIDRLNARIDEMSRRMEERAAAAEQRAAAAEQKADMAASQAQAAAGQADAAARKSEAIFNKSVSKGGRELAERLEAAHSHGNTPRLGDRAPHL